MVYHNRGLFYIVEGLNSLDFKCPNVQNYNLMSSLGSIYGVIEEILLCPVYVYVCSCLDIFVGTKNLNVIILVGTTSVVLTSGLQLGYS